MRQPTALQKCNWAFMVGPHCSITFGAARNCGAIRRCLWPGNSPDLCFHDHFHFFRYLRRSRSVSERRPLSSAPVNILLYRLDGQQKSMAKRLTSLIFLYFRMNFGNILALEIEKMYRMDGTKVSLQPAQSQPDGWMGDILKNRGTHVG